VKKQNYKFTLGQGILSVINVLIERKDVFFSFSFQNHILENRKFKYNSKIKPKHFTAIEKQIKKFCELF